MHERPGQLAGAFVHSEAIAAVYSAGVFGPVYLSPHRDSNPDCIDFKSTASASWAMGGLSYPPTSRRLRGTGEPCEIGGALARGQGRNHGIGKGNRCGHGHGPQS